ncbi:MAG: outer membrane beta-barrel protein [Tangfeifania sp.]
MKRKFLFSLLLIVFSTAIIAQPTFDLGLKAGVNNSKVTFSKDGYTSESIVKYHMGAFGRLGFNRLFVQPEAYYSAKGGEMNGSALDILTRFDYSTIDVPMLLGIKIIDGERANFRIMGGPVFGFFTSKDIDNKEIFDPEYYKNNYVAFQYGIGADLFGFTLDLRMENTASKVYEQSNPDFNGNNKTFMVSVGYKIF